jgi:hypothetical protein
MALTDAEQTKFETYIEEIEKNRSRLSSWEQGFWDDQMKRWDEYKENIHLSAKQWGVLDRMYEKITDLKYEA